MKFHSLILGKYLKTNNAAMQEMGVYISESKRHILVNVTIRWGYMRRHAHTFHVQISMYWQPHSEM